MSAVPRIGEVMTRDPITVDLLSTASAAEKIMAARGIHHLPVVDGQRVFGLISDRDITLSRRAHRDVPFDGRVLVKDLCLEEPFTCAEEETLDAVAARMSSRKVEAAIVVRAGRPVGIFTTNDACRLLARMCRGLPPPAAPRRSLWSRLFG